MHTTMFVVHWRGGGKVSKPEPEFLSFKVSVIDSTESIHDDLSPLSIVKEQEYPSSFL
jgi:hypothetical protein